MECIQFLFDYSQKLINSKNGPGPASLYNGYYKRQDALLKQLQAKGMYLNIDLNNEGNGLPLPDEIAMQFMSPHLIPTRTVGGSWNDIPLNASDMLNHSGGQQQNSMYPGGGGGYQNQSVQYPNPQQRGGSLRPPGMPASAYGGPSG